MYIINNGAVDLVEHYPFTGRVSENVCLCVLVTVSTAHQFVPSIVLDLHIGMLLAHMVNLTNDNTFHNACNYA